MSQTKTQLVEGLNINTSAPADALAVDNNGRVGIGTTSPGAKLTITETSNANAIVIKNADSNGSILSFGINTAIPAAYIQSANEGTGTAQPLAFYNAAGEMGRFDTSGRLLVGTTSARTVDGFTAALQVEGTVAAKSSLIAYRNSNDQYGAYLAFGKSRSASLGGSAVVSNGDEIGVLTFCGADGTDTNSIAARIGAYVDGTPGSNDMPGRLVFSTTADSASSPTERARISSSGRLLVGTSSSDNGGTLCVNDGIGIVNTRFGTVEHGEGVQGTYSTITISFDVFHTGTSVIMETLMTGYQNVYLDSVIGRYGGNTAQTMRNNASSGTSISASVSSYTHTLTISTSVVHPVVKVKITGGGLQGGVSLPTITFTA